MADSYYLSGHMSLIALGKVLWIWGKIFKLARFKPGVTPKLYLSSPLQADIVTTPLYEKGIKENQTKPMETTTLGKVLWIF